MEKLKQYRQKDIYIHDSAILHPRCRMGFYTHGPNIHPTGPTQPASSPKPDPTFTIPADPLSSPGPPPFCSLRARGASGAAAPRGPSASRRLEECRGAGPSAAREQQRVGFARAAARGERELIWGSRIPQVLPPPFTGRSLPPFAN
jgi:hypothetical protein